MKQEYKLFVISLIAFVLLSGCSHKISMDPSLNEIREMTVDKKFNVNVGYFISETDKVKEVTTPGGGGDKVSYTPYKDSESIFNTMLSKVFNRVYSLTNFNDVRYIESKNIKYIFIPKIQTNSSSDSAFTWPPTKFTVALTCEATKPDGSKVWEETVYEEGHAEFSEFKGNFSLSAQRATKKAFQTMLNKLIKSDKFKEEN